MKKLLSFVGVIGLFWSVQSKAESQPGATSSETFWSSGISYVGDYSGAEESAKVKASLECHPLAAVRASEWVEGNVGKYVYMRAGAYFICQASGEQPTDSELEVARCNPAFLAGQIKKWESAKD